MAPLLFTFKRTLSGFLLCLTGLLLTNSALAGVGHSGGGDALVCQESGYTFVYLADTYEIFKDTSDKLLKSNVGVPEVAREAALRVVEQTNPSLAQQLRHALKRLKFIYTPQVLQDVADDNLSLGFWQKKYRQKAQLAVQIFEQRTVYVQKSLYDRLSKLEQGLLQVHEAFVALNQSSYDRSFIRQILKKLTESQQFNQFNWVSLFHSAPREKFYELVFASFFSANLSCFPAIPQNTSIQRTLPILLSLLGETTVHYFSSECFGGFKRKDLRAIQDIYATVPACKTERSSWVYSNGEAMKRAIQVRKAAEDAAKVSSSIPIRQFARDLGMAFCP